MEKQTEHQHEQVCSICKDAEAVEVIQFPHDEELERCVLGALIIDHYALVITIGTLNKELFHKLAHQVIFEAILNLFNNSQAVDLLTVVNELRREGKLEQAGGAEYVSQLSDNIVSSAHIETHIALLVEKHVRREIIRTTATLLKDAGDETRDPFILLDKGMRSLEQILEGISHNTPVSLDSALSKVADDIQFAWDHEMLGIPSGFTSVDTIIQGFHPGTLTVLASKPAMGKTSCALSMARNIALDYRFPVAFFSLQVKRTELILRLISQEMGMPQSHLRNANIITREEKRMIYDKMDELINMPLFIDDPDRINYTQLRCSCRRLVYDHGVRMIFIDGLPQVYASAENNPNYNRANEICHISRKIKSIAQELDIPILITTSFDHRTDNYQGYIPTLSDLQESGGIDEIADMVISIHGLEQDGIRKRMEGRVSLQILKNTIGELGEADLCIDKKSMKFYDQSTSPNTINSNTKAKAGVPSDKKKQENTGDTMDLPF